jgi:hypothetical protein
MSELLWDGTRGLSGGKRSSCRLVISAATLQAARPRHPGCRDEQSLTDPLYVNSAIGEKVVIATL